MGLFSAITSFIVDLFCARILISIAKINEKTCFTFNRSYSNGKQRLSISYIDSKISVLSWYENGTAEQLYQYEKGTPAINKGWYSNGQIKHDSALIRTYEEGEEKEWHKNGQLKSIIVRKGGDVIYSAKYDENGDIISVEGCNEEDNYEEDNYEEDDYDSSKDSDYNDE